MQLAHFLASTGVPALCNRGGHVAARSWDVPGSASRGEGNHCHGSLLRLRPFPGRGFYHSCRATHQGGEACARGGSGSICEPTCLGWRSMVVAYSSQALRSRSPRGDWAGAPLYCPIRISHGLARHHQCREGLCRARERRHRARPRIGCTPRLFVQAPLLGSLLRTDRRRPS